MQDNIKNLADSTWKNDAELTEDDLNKVSGGAVNVGMIKTTPGNIGLGGPDTKGGNTGPATNNLITSSNGFSGPAPQRPN